jgi:ribosome-associated protein
MTDAVDASMEVFIRAVLGRKAVNVVALDVRELTSIADVFIICSGRSSRQVSAIADHIERELRKEKIKPLSVEGTSEGQWVLMDYGSVIIHVFFESVREFYDLEGLWSDAPRITVSAAPKTKPSAGRRPHPQSARE